MKRLIILVEGDCEIILMKKLVIPYLYQRLDFTGSSDVMWSIESVKITTNRKLNKKGGNISYAYLVNDIKRFSSQNCTLITTFFDFFRLPVDFPGYTKDSDKVADLEEAMKSSVKELVPDVSEFLPYIQMYEFEALLFSDIEGFELLVDDEAQLAEIKDIIERYPNPEEINGGIETAPSKRLAHIYDYDKTADSELILEMIGLDVIYNKCPRFREWLNILVAKLTDLS